MRTGRPVTELFRYSHDKGLGEHARGDSLDEDMAGIDMLPDTEVELLGSDDAGWPLVRWEDATRVRRITAIDPDVFDAYFEEVEQ